MSVSNPNKTVSKSQISCGETAAVTLSFQAAAELSRDPADIILIMDRSGSMIGSPLTEVKTAAKNLIRTVSAASGSVSGETIDNGSRMALISFSDRAVTDCPLGVRTEGLYAAIDAMSGGGGTNHEAAFKKAKIMLETDSSKNVRQIIILFTDGESNIGDPEAVIASVKQEGAEIFCVGLVSNQTTIRRWASDPDAEHVAATGDVTQLQRVFDEIVAEVVRAGALDMMLKETLAPEFRIVQVYPPTHGTATVTGPQTLQWSADAVGTAAEETASLTFDIQHIGTSGGTLPVNASVVYTDRAGQTLVFPEPMIHVACSDTVLYPETCPPPADFIAEGCRDMVTVSANETFPGGLGRIISVDAWIRHVCPNRRIAAAVILTETGIEGEEYARGMKTILIPARKGTECMDVQLKGISFVVPEALDEEIPDSLCNDRKFHVRVLANYIDSDFSCCDAQTILRG